MAKHKTNIVEEMKDLLSDPKNRIKLDDFVTEHLKTFLEAVSLQHFPVQGLGAQKEEFLKRMKAYEEIVKDLQKIIILVSRWGEGDQLSVLEKVFTRIGEADKGSSGLTLWINFNWYPIQILMYSAGIAALSAKKYEALKITLTTPIQYKEHGYFPLVVPVASNLADIHDAFKWIPGHEKKYVPKSEHLFEIIETPLHELLFLGREYEKLFDDFEVYSALIYADAMERDWGPIGRFGWKHSRGIENSPLNRIIKEAEVMQNKWPPVRVGMFNGSLDRFMEVSKVFKERLDKLSWW